MKQNQIWSPLYTRMKKLSILQLLQKMNQNSTPKSLVHLKSEFPFYKTYIDIQCRKDILTQNQHVNKKVQKKITPFLKNITRQAKLNKYRLIYFFGFVAIFKLEPVYDYVFCKNRAINWIYNNFINYYMDWTKPIPQSVIQTQKHRKIIQKSHINNKYAALFYKIDKNSQSIIGYNDQNQNFIKDELHEIPLQKFVEVCNQKYGQNYAQAELKLKNIYPECFY